MRSYAHAAFRTAMMAATDPEIPVKFESFTFYQFEVEAVGDQIEGFEPKRLRSGIETALASLGINREVRAQLQSHGLGGVQDRHYDDHDYMPEKRAALQALLDLLNMVPADNVTSINGRSAA